MFYVRVATRSSGAAAQGSPRQALGYLADNHDREHDAGSSEAELNYIARLDPGWKTDLEGGRVPLVGYGTLKGVTEDQLVSRFEDACQPHHDTRGSTGYKSLTFTLPKEVSLFAEGHREEAKAAMHAAVPRPSGEIPWPFACPRPHRSFRRMAAPSSSRPAAGWQQDSLGTAGSSRTVVGHLLAPYARMPGPIPASAAAPPGPAGASACQRPLRRSGRSVQPGTGW